MQLLISANSALNYPHINEYINTQYTVVWSWYSYYTMLPGQLQEVVYSV